MAGPLTNFSIAALLFGTVFAGGLALLISLADGNQVTLDNNFSEFTNYQNDALTVTGQYNNATNGATINTQSIGSAQLQGLISAEQTKTGFFTMFNKAINQAFKYFPVQSSIISVFGAILLIIFGAAVYRAIRGVDP